MASALMGEVRAQQSVIPFLYKPFNGSYAVNAHFDHDTPNQQTNGFVRTFLGEARYDISYDGHEGWDYALPNRTEVLAAASGRAWSQWYDPEHSNVGYGYYVRIDHDGHGQGYRTIYGHLTADLALAPGGYIGRGAIIGLSGNTGNVQGANGGYHLHFGACQIANANVRENCWVGPTSTRFVDPNGWYGSGVDPLNNGLVSQWLWADQGPWLRFTSRLGEGTNRQDREVYIDVRNVNGTYPVAQNTHQYQDAHRQLYGCTIDGLNKDAITALGKHLGQSVNAGDKNTIKALRQILPTFYDQSVLRTAFDKIGEQRRPAAHGARPPAQVMAAFEEFTHDLNLVVSGLREFLAHLEQLLGVNAMSAKQRVDAMNSLPKIVKPALPHYAISKAPQMVGKTIERVEFGEREGSQYRHQSEALILYFSDGSIMAIDTGSNALNIHMDHEEIPPSFLSLPGYLIGIKPALKT